METKNKLEIVPLKPLKKAFISRTYNSLLRADFQELTPRPQSNWSLYLGVIPKEQ